MIVAAIYARKSTEQSSIADEQKSVTRQVDHARAYAARRGWIVDDASVYVDDGISGAEFDTRPGFLRLINALKPRPRFGVLIMSEVSRLGREQIATAYALKQLSVAGVRCFSYLEDREVLLESATDKFLLGAMTFAADLEREKARQRTYDALLRKARAGHVCGGRVFGYANVVVMNGSRRSHVTRTINEAEAAIIRRIFALSAEGYGMKAIAKRLNREGARSPQAQQGRPHSWAPSSVRTILFRDAYRGVVTWNRTRKRNQWGAKHPTARLTDEWIAIEAPQLRIVSDDEWRAAHARVDRARTIYTDAAPRQPFGRPALGNPSKYLLTNLCLCGRCGGSLEVLSRTHGKQGRKYFYGCAAYHERGTCTNQRMVPMAEANAIVVETLLDDVLDERLLRDAVDEALGLVDGGPDHAAVAQLGTELKMLERERGRLLTAARTGDRIVGLLEALQALNRRQQDLEAERDALTARSGLMAGRGRDEVRADLLDLAAQWRRVLIDDPSHARPIVSSLLDGRVIFTPLKARTEWELRGAGSSRGLFTRILQVGVTSPGGLDTVLSQPFRRRFRAA